MLTLYRTPVIDETPHGRIRRLFLVTARGGIFAGIEHAEVAAAMPYGEYRLTMATMRTKKMKALWLPQTDLFAHPANTAEDLRGCWAVGDVTSTGVNRSRLAFEAIFSEYGGFYENKEIGFRLMPQMDLSPFRPFVD